MEPIQVPDQSEKGDYKPQPVIPGGEYMAALRNVTEKPGYNPGDGNQWMWEFELFTPFAGHKMWLWTSQKLGAFTENGVTKKSKARLALEALLRRELQPKEVLNWGDLIGEACVLMVAREPRKDATNETLRDGTGWRNKITAVVPLSDEVQDFPTKPALPFSPEVEVPVSSLDRSLDTRFQNSVALLKYGIPQIKDVIEMIAMSRQPFFELSTDAKQKVVDYLDMLLQQPENDIPFDDDERPMEPAVVLPKEEPVRSIGQRQIPASAGLKVS